MLACVGSVYGQGAEKHTGTTARSDPYTGGEAAALAAAGYAGIGAMRWTSSHSTRDIEVALGELPYVWIETAHFRIGSTLPPAKVGKKTRKKLRAELTRLNKKLPSVDPKTKTIDRWLRAHLYAQRCEELYSEFSRQLGVDDSSFAQASRQRANDDCMGVGPYLGQAQKFLLLMLEKESDFARYTERFLGGRVRYPKRHNFGMREGLLFGTSLALHDGYRDDAMLHGEVVYNVACNLIDGYKSYCQRVPAWWSYGFGLWHAQQIAPDFQDIERATEKDPDLRKFSNWYPKVYRLVKNGGIPSVAELITPMDTGAFLYRHYLASWSLVEFLMSEGETPCREFMNRLKTPLYDEGEQVLPGDKELVKHQAKALMAAWGYDAKALEAAWHKHVLRRYRKKR